MVNEKVHGEKQNKLSLEDVDEDSLGKNPVLLTQIVELIGAEVELELVDRRRYKGVLHACSSEFDIGLSFAQQMPVSEEDRLCMTSANTIKKIVFPSRDVIYMSGVVEQKCKDNKAFATDAEIGRMRNGGNELLLEGDEKDFEEWQYDGDEGNESLEFAGNLAVRGDGWTVDEMLRVNAEKGVTSSFDPSLAEYSTVEPVGSEEDKRRASRIAREIEKNPLSRRQAMLENDDEERDLDVETNFSHENQQKQRRGGGPRSFGNRDRYNKNMGSWRRPQNRTSPGTAPVININREEQSQQPQQQQPKAPPAGTVIPTSTPDITSAASAKNKQEAVEKGASTKFAFNPDAMPFVPAALKGGGGGDCPPDAITKNSSYSGDGSGRSSVQQPQQVNLQVDPRAMPHGVPMGAVQSPYTAFVQHFQQLSHHQQPPPPPPLQQPVHMQQMPPPFPVVHVGQQYAVYGGQPTIVAAVPASTMGQHPYAQPMVQQQQQMSMDAATLSSPIAVVPHNGAGMQRVAGPPTHDETQYIRQNSAAGEGFQAAELQSPLHLQPMGNPQQVVTMNSQPHGYEQGGFTGIQVQVEAVRGEGIASPAQQHPYAGGNKAPIQSPVPLNASLVSVPPQSQSVGYIITPQASSTSQVFPAVIPVGQYVPSVPYSTVVVPRNHQPLNQIRYAGNGGGGRGRGGGGGGGHHPRSDRYQGEHNNGAEGRHRNNKGEKAGR